MKRKHAINDLRSAINRHHGSKLTALQVELWVGSDSNVRLIREFCTEVNFSKGSEGVNPDDILSVCGNENL